MQNIIKHKRISSLAILIILVFVFAMSIAKSAEGGVKSAGGCGLGPQEDGPDSRKSFIIEIHFAPVGVAPGEYVQVMANNNNCCEAAPTKLKVFNADNGNQVGTTFLGDIDPGKGVIESFLVQPHDRRNIVVTVESRCPRRALKFGGQDQFPFVILEVVNSDDDSTTRRIEPDKFIADGQEFISN